MDDIHYKSSIQQVKVTRGRPVLKVREICDLLEIEVPIEYQEFADKFVTETSLFDVLEEKDQLISEISEEIRQPEGYFNGLGSSPKKFKDRFLNISDDFEKSDDKLLEMFVHWQYTFRIRGFWFRDYFDYKLHNRSIEEAEKFISAGYRYDIARASNTKEPKYTKYFAQKSLFNKKFGKYVNREFLEIKSSSLDNFKKFIDKNPRFFGKPLHGTGGFGAGVWEISEEDDIEKIFKECQRQNLIIEEIVKQHKEIEEFNRDTLNTVRIYSLLTANNEIIITLATIRMGRIGGSVDNFHSGGMGAAVDVKTGIIYTEAVDMNGNRYMKHPDSGKQIKGFKIPNWDKAIKAIKDVAHMIKPDFGHIGWDIAFTDKNEVEFMEGNTIPNFHIPQVVDQIGKKFVYEKYINNLNARKEKEEKLLLKDFVYDSKDNQVRIIGYTGKDKKIKIPKKIENKEVSIIGSGAFSGLLFLEHIIIPESVRTIYREAFKNCASLKKIKLPEGLTVLNAETFKDCTSLESIGLPYDLERICQSAFEGCSSLKQLYYFSKRGISDVMKTDHNLRENHLPTLIDYMGNAAFKNCSSLLEITLPYKVKVINESVFEGCTSLEKVHVHNLLKTVKENAFAGCISLKEIKLPLILKKISDNAFDPMTTLVCEEISSAYKYANKHGLNVKPLIKLDEMPQLSSQMIPYSQENEFIPLEKHQLFYTNDELDQMIEKYEMRMPSYEVIQRESMDAPLPVKSARYDFKDGVYINKNKTTNNRAVIMMTGDLMTHYRQQRLAYDEKDRNYYFDDSFYFVKDILAQSDFAVGNMETMISPSSPFTCEKEHVNARPHLNAPENFLSAIRNASFDAVVNAQNHVYDTGTMGIMETLDMHNKYQLMHTGAYASPSDKRYIIVEVNNIRIAILAYFDGARQLMKKANFTKIGREILLNIHTEEQIEKDVAAAKTEGAEFIIAYCHWGREYTHDLTDRQKEFAKGVANSGVDYIFGSHSHCVQPYDEIKTKDKRKIPVLYSGGNFLSAINVKPPITRDTLIAEITLVKDENGAVHIDRNGYYPCRIMELGETEKNYAVIPTQVKFKGDSNKSSALKNAEKRIEKVLGDKISKLKPKSINLDINYSPFNI